MAAIDISHVSFAYKDHHQTDLVLRDVDLHIRDGEFVCIIGHSGCGKSTLLNLVAGLLLPDGGRVELSGRPIDGPGTDRAMVFQHYSLFPWMTAKNNVVFGIRQAKKTLKKNQALRLAQEYLQKVGMEQAGGKYPYQLSGGMQQRVAIARALAMDSPILLLDEPFGALDAKRRAELQQLLAELWDAGSRRKTVLFVTHDIDEALLLADRIVFMRPGKIEAELKVPYARPRLHEEISGAASYESLKAELLDLFYLDWELAADADFQ
ncbi:MAG: ABC transporter ATP-binding protein [Clostridia bacterium]|nr:ABC transporter ATP-binding protein [Clostridia bacterium]